MQSIHTETQIPRPRQSAAIDGRVAILSSVHAPDDIRIYKKEALSLQEVGLDVSLVIPPRNDAGEPRGVRHVAVTRARGRVGRMLVTTTRVVRAGLKTGAQVFHFHDPELMPFGVALKALGKKVIYDVHEDLPLAILSKHWIYPTLRPIVSKGAALVERLCSNCFDGVIAATPHIAKHLPADRTIVVQNFPLAGELYPSGSSPYAERSPDFVYVGGISGIRGAREMVQAAGLLEKRPAATVHFAGAFTPSKLESELTQLPGWSRVRRHGFLPRTRTAALMAQCRAGLVLFHPEPNHIAAQPNKLFEYMSAGLPVIASDFPLWREIVIGNKCGLVVDPLDPRGIAIAMEWILEHPVEAAEMGRNGLRAVETKYTWAAEAKKLVEMYARLFA